MVAGVLPAKKQVVAQGAAGFATPTQKPAPPPVTAPIDRLEQTKAPPKTRLEVVAPPAIGLTDKRYGRTGYFEYRLDDNGRIWTRYNPVLAPAPFDLPVTEPP